MTEVIYLITGITLAASVGLAYAWRSRGRRITELATQCKHLEASLAAVKRSLVGLSVQGRVKQAEAAQLAEKLAASDAKMEQLRDLVKVHVARRREFEEWANPIRASLGEGIGQVMRALKDRLARQEFALRRQENVVSEAQDLHRGTRDELERLQRELTLKNYHIAALNERFIRLEERMQELGVEIYGPSSEPLTNPPPTLSSAEVMSPPDSTRSPSPQSPETERFTLERYKDKDWMGVLDDWHRQLQARFERLAELQGQIKGVEPKPAPESKGAAETPAQGSRGRENPAA